MYPFNKLIAISFFFSWQVVLIIKSREISSVEEGECMKSEKINNRINS